MGARTDIGSRIIKNTFHRRFAMARLTRLPVLGQAVEFAFFEKDDMIYLPRDSAVLRSKGSRTIQMDVEVGPTNTVLPSQVIDHFLRRSRYIFIMNRCMCRNSNHCQDYPHELGCIFLGRGVTRIPSKMGRMATAEEAVEHMRKAREHGLVHLIGRNKIDSIWLNAGPKEDLLSICNCCPCCCLWKMIPQLSDSIAGSVTRMPGVEVRVTDNCTGCGRCSDEGWCFVNAISVRDGRAVVDERLCKGCGRCAENCPSGGMELKINDPAFFEKSVARIEPLVNVESE